MVEIFDYYYKISEKLLCKLVTIKQWPVKIRVFYILKYPDLVVSNVIYNYSSTAFKAGSLISNHTVYLSVCLSVLLSTDLFWIIVPLPLFGMMNHI